jgi:hypothetical protein
MNFYPTYDETYHEHNEPPFHPIPEHHECECGAELTRENPPVPCDCGADCCSECVHICTWCDHEGCETCMTDTVDGWCHTEECAARNKAAEDRKDAEWPETLRRLREAG